MKILKVGSVEPNRKKEVELKEYTKSCKKCDCEFSFTDKDVNNFPGGTFLFCPCCGEMLNVSDMVYAEAYARLNKVRDELV